MIRRDSDVSQSSSELFPAPDAASITTQAAGPAGSLPLTDEMLRSWSSGDLFGLTQSAGMGWAPDRLLGDQYLILSTQGGVREPDGSPVALGYHTGHWEVGLLVREAAQTIRQFDGVPYAAFCSDPCDGRTQGTRGMFDSLPYRNDAAIVLRRLIRSLPRRKAVIGVATCDKGLPAMMLALCGCPDLPSVLVPGGVTLPPTVGEDAGKVQSIGAALCSRRNHTGTGVVGRLPSMRNARRWVPISGHGGDRASRRRSARDDGTARGAGAERPKRLAASGPRQRFGSCAAGGARADDA